jgi:hypothetical protein
LLPDQWQARVMHIHLPEIPCLRADSLRASRVPRKVFVPAPADQRCMYQAACAPLSLV